MNYLLSLCHKVNEYVAYLYAVIIFHNILLYCTMYSDAIFFFTLFFKFIYLLKKSIMMCRYSCEILDILFIKYLC